VGGREGGREGGSERADGKRRADGKGRGEQDWGSWDREQGVCWVLGERAWAGGEGRGGGRAREESTFRSSSRTTIRAQGLLPVVEITPVIVELEVGRGPGEVGHDKRHR